MLKVALTGGIATGKSYVLERLRRPGVATLDADVLAHGVTAPGSEASRAIAARFGEEILEAGGGIDRQKLGEIVFADPSARRDLEAIVHPAVYRAITAGFRAFELLGGTRLAVADIPLLYETGRAREFDRVIATVCAVDVQISRLMDRGLTQEAAQLRLNAQLPAAEKAARADYVIRTDGTKADTDAQIERLLTLLLP